MSLMYREQAAPWEYIRLADIQHAQAAASDVQVCVWGGYTGWWLRSQRQAGTETGTKVGGVIASAHLSRCLRGWELCLGWGAAYFDVRWLHFMWLWGSRAHDHVPGLVITRCLRLRQPSAAPHCPHKAKRPCSPIASVSMCIRSEEWERSWLHLWIITTLDKRSWSSCGGENETHLKGLNSKAAERNIPNNVSQWRTTQAESVKMPQKSKNVAHVKDRSTWSKMELDPNKHACNPEDLARSESCSVWTI